MGPIKRRIALVAAGLTVPFAAVPGAHAQPKPDPVAHAACVRAPCDIPDKLTTPPGGSATETLPVPTALTGAIIVKPSQPKPNPEDVQFFNQLRGVLSSVQSPRARVAGCFLLADVLNDRSAASEDFTESGPLLSLLFVRMCLQIVLDLQKQATHPTADAAAAGCPQMRLAVPVKITRTGNQYRLHAQGTARADGRRTGLSVSCRRLKVGFQISVRPAKRGQQLRKVTGPTLAIGFVNPTSRSVPIRTTVAFR